MSEMGMAAGSVGPAVCGIERVGAVAADVVEFELDVADCETFRFGEAEIEVLEFGELAESAIIDRLKIKLDSAK